MIDFSGLDKRVWIKKCSSTHLSMYLKIEFCIWNTNIPKAKTLNIILILTKLLMFILVDILNI